MTDISRTSLPSKGAVERCLKNVTPLSVRTDMLESQNNLSPFFQPACSLPANPSVGQCNDFDVKRKYLEEEVSRLAPTERMAFYLTVAQDRKEKDDKFEPLMNRIIAAVPFLGEVNSDRFHIALGQRLEDVRNSYLQWAAENAIDRLHLQTEVEKERTFNQLARELVRLPNARLQWATMKVIQGAYSLADLKEGVKLMYTVRRRTANAARDAGWWTRSNEPRGSTKEPLEAVAKMALEALNYFLKASLARGLTEEDLLDWYYEFDSVDPPQH